MIDFWFGVVSGVVLIVIMHVVVLPRVAGWVFRTPPVADAPVYTMTETVESATFDDMEWLRNHDDYGWTDPVAPETAETPARPTPRRPRTAATIKSAPKSPVTSAPKSPRGRRPKTPKTPKD